MTAGNRDKRAGRAPRLVGAVLAAVLLPLGVALVIYSFASGDTTMNASPPTTLSPSPILSPLPVMTVDASSTPNTPNTPVVVITTLVEVQLPTSGGGGQDSLNLVATVAGLLASVAGIVSAFISARAARSS